MRRYATTKAMAPLGAIALFFSCLLAASFLGCAPRPPEGPREYPFPAETGAAFALGDSGFVALSSGAGSGAAAAALVAGSAGGAGGVPRPLPLATRVAALAADAESGTVMAALNGFGLGILRLSPDGSAWKLLNLPLEEAKTGSVAALWPRGKDFLLELYRDPFVEGGPARSDAAPELLVLDRTGKTSRLERLGLPGEDLFALFPSPSGKWYAELRTEKKLGASTRYLELAWPESVVGSRVLTRADFEASLAPKPLSLAPAALRAAVSAIASGTASDAAPGGPEPLLVRARGGEGSESFWISGGSVEDSVEVHAWVAKGEDRAIALAPDGRGAFMETGATGPVAFKLAAPEADARFSAVTALFPAAGSGKPGLVVAAWDSGNFPDVALSGLVVAPLR